MLDKYFPTTNPLAMHLAGHQGCIAVQLLATGGNIPRSTNGWALQKARHGKPVTACLVYEKTIDQSRLASVPPPTRMTQEVAKLNEPRCEVRIHQLHGTSCIKGIETH